jgi:hypothetical protein
MTLISGKRIDSKRLKEKRREEKRREEKSREEKRREEKSREEKRVDEKVDPLKAKPYFKFKFSDGLTWGQCPTTSATYSHFETPPRVSRFSEQAVESTCRKDDRTRKTSRKEWSTFLFEFGRGVHPRDENPNMGKSQGAANKVGPSRRGLSVKERVE